MTASRVVVSHRDGVPWYKAPIPARWHKCKPWTAGWIELTLIDRCACGAITRNGSDWLEKNARRKGNLRRRFGRST